MAFPEKLAKPSSKNADLCSSNRDYSDIISDLNYTVVKRKCYIVKKWGDTLTFHEAFVFDLVIYIYILPKKAIFLAFYKT